MSAEESVIVEAAIAEHGRFAGAALPILLAIQDRLGHVPDAAVPRIAEALNLSRAEIHGVATFYHDIKHEPQGRHVLRLCRAEACQSAGGRRLADEARRMLGIDFGQTTADGRVTLEPAYCLGLCAAAPAAMMDTRPAGRLDRKGLAALIGEAV